MPYRNQFFHQLSTNEKDFIVMVDVLTLHYSLVQAKRCRLEKIAHKPRTEDLNRLPNSEGSFTFAVDKRNKTLSMLTSKYIGRQPQVWIVDMKVKL